MRTQTMKTWKTDQRQRSHFKKFEAMSVEWLKFTTRRIGGRSSNLDPSAGKDSERGTNHLLGHKFSLQAASVNGMSRWGNGCVPGAKWAACCCVARSPRGSLILMLLQSLSFGPGKPLPEEGGFPLLKIYELPLNGLGWPAATLHAFRGFPATKVPGNLS